MSVDSVVDALTRVRENIARSAQRAGREAGDVILVAVTKGVSEGKIREARASGQLDFGENRVNEAVGKVAALSDLSGIRWHFVGRLQRNKIKALSDFRPIIHSLDRWDLAKEIARRFEEPVEVLCQVNTADDGAKGGIHPDDLEKLIENCLETPNLHVTGLMTMAPAMPEPEQARRYFRALAALGDQMKKRFPEAMIHHLSMGMSQDYEVAIEEGATMVRVGRAIFGEAGAR